MTVPWTTRLWHGDLILMQQIPDGVALRIFGQRTLVDIRSVTFEHNLAPQTASIRPDINQVVRSAHKLFIVFDDDDRISQRLELFQYMDQPFCVATVQSDTRFVEDIERTDQ